MLTQQQKLSHGNTQPIPLIQFRNKPAYMSIEFWTDVLYKIVVTCILFIFIGYVQSATASTGIEMERVSQGTLFYKSVHDNHMRTAPVLKTDVELRVTGFINRAHVTQTFHNGSDDWVEGIYVFPLPENAAVDQMHIRVGERVIEGKIKERSLAKKVYEKAKAQGKRASLLEQERPNMFTTSVANIGPGETVNIEIEFQQTLRYNQGWFQLRFPLAITPRYIPGKVASGDVHAYKSISNKIEVEDSEDKSAVALPTINSSSKPTDQVPDADRITPFVVLNKKINPVSLNIELDAGFPVDRIESSYHSIEKQMQDTGSYRISLSEGEVPADHDFEISWKPVQGNAPRAAMFQETVDDKHFYLVMMLPPEQKENKTLALAKEVIYVIDTSGSMGGVSIRQARKALLMALDRLRPNDTFNVIEFNSSTSKLFRYSMPATVQNLAEARVYVRNLQAKGGTEMMGAMRAALSKHEDSQRLRQVIFLTDGAIGNEDALFEHIRHYLGSSRLFTVGIGSAPNSHFMSKAAQFGRGTFTYIGDVNEVANKMQVLFSKLDTPVMRDLKIVQHLGDFEMWPQTLPDLYAGEPLIFTARSSVNHGEVTLLGKRHDEEWQARFHLQGASVGEGIGKLWARNKIDALTDTLDDGADKETVRNGVINLALTHYLVSKYTSLVAVDVTPVRPLDASLTSKAMPTNLPHGQDAKKIFGLNAKTGTEQYLLFIAGGLLMLLAISLGYIRQDPVIQARSKSCIA